MTKQSTYSVDIVADLISEQEIRHKKLVTLRKQKNTPFPNKFRRNYVSDQLHLEFNGKTSEELKKINIEVAVAGRIISCRVMGKASFVTIQDMGGCIQLYVSCNSLTTKFYNEDFKTWDLGDIIGVKGKLFKTKTGELSINCTELNLLTKSLRPLPNKFHGLKDKEICYRQRYLDLISNKKSRKIFKIRSDILANIRQFMANLNFLEVETPMIQSIPGGAAARPFVTHHNDLGLDMYLRISPELYLKRLVVGGFERIFEINRSFRNEGISASHNPEFTMMEIYMAYADYNDLIEMTESLFRTLTQNILGTTKIHYGETIFDFSKKFERLTMHKAIVKYLPEINLSSLSDLNSAKKIAENIGIKIENNWEVGRIITEIFEEVVKAHLIQPTFVTEYPIEVSPLARRNDYNPKIADRFELFMGGYEIGNGFSELNDAEDQIQRFYSQILEKNTDLNDKKIFLDKDYIVALEHGLPPTAGLGIGIDRMVMMLTNSKTIRDVILFPTMRPSV